MNKNSVGKARAFTSRAHIAVLISFAFLAALNQIYVHVNFADVSNEPVFQESLVVIGAEIKGNNDDEVFNIQPITLSNSTSSADPEKNNQHNSTFPGSFINKLENAKPPPATLNQLNSSISNSGRKIQSDLDVKMIYNESEKALFRSDAKDFDVAPKPKVGIKPNITITPVSPPFNNASKNVHIRSKANEDTGKPTPIAQQKTQHSSIHTVKVFYNVYTGPNNHSHSEDIVKEQLALLRPEHDLLVHSIGDLVEMQNATLVQHSDQGNQIDTLGLLWQYCKNHANDNVAYIHNNKGSFHESKLNNKLRRFLTRGALSDKCSNMPPSCNVCSSRMSPLPYPHTSGNMWVGRCDYVSRLMNPLEYHEKINLIYDAGGENSACFGTGSYAAQHWIYSHPSAQPCDLSTDDRFTWNFDSIPEGEFEMKQEPAPRFEFKKYDKPGVCPPQLIKLRLREYTALYNETAPESWWGWNFYNVSDEIASGKQNKAPTDISPAVVDRCKCVYCDDDELCGGLWKATKFPPIDDSDPHNKKIHIVVSHCKGDLHWLSDFTKNYGIASTHVITKCGEPVRGAPANTTIQQLPNVGRCDHTYAYYIANILEKRIVKGQEKDSIFMFIKDDMSAANSHQQGKWANFDSMVRLASSTNGFSCGIDSSTADINNISLSVYHKLESLFMFQIKAYVRKQGFYADNKVDFRSNYPNLGAFYKDNIDAAGPFPEIVQVCYGGIFAASYPNIKKVDSIVWRKLEKVLSRGNSIEEGHLMERSWGAILATPLEPYQVEAIINYADDSSTFQVGGGLLAQAYSGVLERHRSRGL